MGGRIWLPWIGWQQINRDLRRRLERAFSIPMIVIALMILPLLALEFGNWQWAQSLRALPGVPLMISIGTTVIWFAFAVEFIIMVSIAEKKLTYCVQHWLDLAIILLPMIAFLRTTRVLRLGRAAQQLTRMVRLYRLRGLSLRAWRAILLLNVIQRITGRSLERQIVRLEQQLVEKEEELNELRKQLQQLRARSQRDQLAATQSVTENT